MIPVRVPGGTMVIAHRGGGDEEPENSLRAFAHARDLGLRNLETDVQLTSDGVVVLHHDPMVDLTHDGSGLISMMTWQELSELRDPKGGRIPRLSEALEAFPDMYFNIDAKSEDVVDPLLEVLEAHDAEERVVLASFSERRLRRIRAREHGSVSTSLGVSAVARLTMCSWAASSPVVWRVPGPSTGARAVQVPEVARHVRVITPRFVAQAHRAGLAVHVWTVNDAADMMRVAEMGVDAIITDRPTVARDLLEARGRWAVPEPPRA